MAAALCGAVVVRSCCCRRKRVLRHFLHQPSIYATEYFRERLEAQAQLNLRRAIAEL